MFFFTFFAGVASFFSPCLIPVLPGFLATLTGNQSILNSDNEKNISLYLKSALSFGAGLSIVYMILGAISSGLGSYILEYGYIITKVVGILLVLFGLSVLGVFSFSFTLRERKLDANKLIAKINYPNIRAFIIGLCFAFAWTPCIGPLLSSVLSFIVMKGSLSYGILLMLTFSAGLWIPFLISAIFIRYIMGFIKGHRKLIFNIYKGSGVILIIIGLLVFFNKFSAISGFFI